MIEPGARRKRFQARQRMIRRRDRNEFDRTDDNSFQFVMGEGQRAAHSKHDAAIHHQTRHSR
jgi:hypothetical protein